MTKNTNDQNIPKTMLNEQKPKNRKTQKPKNPKTKNQKTIKHY